MKPDSTIIEFFVPGIPATTGSKRPFIYKAKKDGKQRVAMVPDNKRQKPWMAVVALAAEHAMGERLPFSGPMSCEIHFELPRPRSHYGTGKNAANVKDSSPRWPTSKPDLDKMARAVKDAMTGVVWRDDSQVVESRLFKRYGPTPGANITVSQLAKPKGWQEMRSGAISKDDSYGF